jgi:G6PDH family F420-dependent oxidoreductase
MAKIGYFLSSEEHGAKALVDQAVSAERAGFEALWISDHYHPWNDEQGQSAFVWSVLGAIAQATERIPVYTAVTCPTVRIHPAVVAQAAATAAVLLDGRFGLGVGTGEALNEHIFGDAWPETDVRLDMLEEAIELMRRLWEGASTSHRGKHYTVENARIYTLPEAPPPILVSGFGPKSIELAGRIGDGYMSTMPDAEMVQQFRAAGGGDKPTHAGLKVCWGEDEASALKTVYRLWPNSGLPGELSQVLPTPRHFEQASSLVTEEMIGESVVCGPDLERHVEAVQQYVDAGYDEVYVGQIGPDQDGFFAFYEREVLPRLR